MRGEIHVDSTSGQGAVFTLELPANVAPEPTQAVADAPPLPGMPERVAEPADAPTVLVIDDDWTVRDLMARLLEKMGYHAVLASSGEEGLRLARQLRPSIITLDVVMPDLSGWDVLDQLKADSQLASIPVIMVTIVDQEALGLARGASTHLVKPIDRDQLSLALEKHCARPRPEADRIPA
jgi:CheY-like chemotaxis protein